LACSVPGKLFWSVTVYDAEARSQVQTDRDKAALRSIKAGSPESFNRSSRLPERTVPTEATTATTLDVLHDDYDAWCTGNGLQAISRDAFADEFDRLREIDELAGNIRKVGNRYYGIKLTDTKVTKLPAQRRDRR
jgi:hypothetical protein